MSPGELNRENPHCAQSAMDENTLSGSKIRTVKQPLPGSQCADWNRSRLGMRQTSGFCGNPRWLRDAVFRCRPVGKPIVHAEHLAANFNTINTLTQSGNDTGKLMSRYRSAPLLAAFAMADRAK